MSLVPATIPARTNACVNPSAETNTTGWTGVRGTLTREVTRAPSGAGSIGHPWVGSHLFQIAVTDATSGFGPYPRISGIPAVAGQVVTVWCKVACSRAGVGGRVFIAFLNGSGATLTSRVETFTVVGTSEWTTLISSDEAPTGSATIQVDVQAANTAANAGMVPIQVGDRWWVDGVDIRVGESFDAYIDGDQPGSRWTGTAHASTSIRDEAAAEGPTGRGGVYRLTSRAYLADMHNVLGRNITDHVLGGSVDSDEARQAEKSLLKLTLDDPLLVLPPYGFAAPFVDVLHENGDKISAQLGLYQLQQPSVKLNRAAGYEADVDGADLVGWMSTRIFNGKTEIPIGQNVATSIRNLLEGEGITRHDIPDLGRVMSYTRTYRKSTNILPAINRQGRSGGLMPLFMRGDGYLSMVPYRSINKDEPARVYRLDEDSAIAGEITVQRDDSELYNVVTATRNDPAKGTTLIAIARNDDPASPSSTVNIGERARPQPIVVNDAVDNDTLMDIAQWHLERSSAQVQMTFDVLPDPMLAIHQTIEIKLSDTQWLDLVKRQAAGRWFVGKVQHGLDYTAGTRLTCYRTLTAERAVRV